MEQEKDQNSNFMGMHELKASLGFMERDNDIKQQQYRNQISFKLIRNDQNHENLKLLIDLKNIFSRQLPRMPKEYIVRLVFDRNHQSMIILKNKSQVVGGICFREFKAQRFAEIVFLAITSTEQLKGFGTRLMNKFKEQMQSIKVQYLVTYADNLALGYFIKQGFSTKYGNDIKDYEGGTLMECYVHPIIDYQRITEIIKNQKEFVLQKIKELSITKQKLDQQKMQNKPNQPFIRKNGLGQEEQFKMNPMDIPGIQESGWIWQEHQQLLKKKQNSFSINCRNLLDLMKNHRSAWPFLNPVSLQEVPDYHRVIKQPIDLKTISKRLKNNEYKDIEKFCDDITKMFTNCKTYNQPETIYYKLSVQLQEYIKPHLQALQQGYLERIINENAQKSAEKKIRSRDN